jgi:hypothetical protein
MAGVQNQMVHFPGLIVGRFREGDVKLIVESRALRPPNAGLTLVSEFYVKLLAMHALVFRLCC